MRCAGLFRDRPLLQAPCKTIKSHPAWREIAQDPSGRDPRASRHLPPSECPSNDDGAEGIAPPIPNGWSLLTLVGDQVAKVLDGHDRRRRSCKQRPAHSGAPASSEWPSAPNVRGGLSLAASDR